MVMTIGEKKSGDGAAAAVMLECFHAKYLALCGGNEEAARSIAKEEMNWRGTAGNMFLAKEEGRTAGVVELITAGARTVPDSVFMDLYMKHLGLGAGLRGLYLLSFLGRAVGRDECAVAQLGVLPEFRRRGVGRALLARAGEFAQEKRKKRLSLWVDESNTPAVRLYESEGFVVAERKESVNTGRFFGIPVWLKMEKVVDSAD